MEQSKFSLADVLTVIGALAFSFVCYLGLNFLTVGKTLFCVLGAVAVFALVFTPSFLAKFFKTRARNFKTSLALEFSMVALFVICYFLLAFLLFPVLFNVSGNKSVIQRTIQDEIGQAELMFDSYENYANSRIEQYKLHLQSVVQSKKSNTVAYNDYGFAGDTNISDETKIDTKLFTISANLFPSDFVQTKEEATRWFSKAKATISHWRVIGVVSVVNKVEDEAENWRDRLVETSTYRAQCENADDFSYDLSIRSVKDLFQVSPRPTVVSSLIAILIFLVMSFSWIWAKRSTRFPGWKYLFSNSKDEVDNEL